MKNTMKKITAIAMFVMIIAAVMVGSAFADEFEEYEFYQVDDDSYFVNYTDNTGSETMYVEYQDDVFTFTGSDYNGFIFNDDDGSEVIYVEDANGDVIYYEDDEIIYYVTEEDAITSATGTNTNANNKPNQNNANQNTTQKTYNAVIIKNPTAETVKEGGKASFVAGSTNVQSMTWQFVSADGKTIIEIPQEAFSGKEMKSISKEAEIFENMKIKTFIDSNGYYNIEFSDIDAAANGWSVQARFVGRDGGVVTTVAATITVK